MFVTVCHVKTFATCLQQNQGVGRAPTGPSPQLRRPWLDTRPFIELVSKVSKMPLYVDVPDQTCSFAIQQQQFI